MIHRWRFYNFRATLRVPQVPLIRTTECQWSQLCPNFPPRFRSRRTAQRDHITAGSIVLYCIASINDFDIWLPWPLAALYFLTLYESIMTNPMRDPKTGLKTGPMTNHMTDSMNNHQIKTKTMTFTMNKKVCCKLGLQDNFAFLWCFYYRQTNSIVFFCRSFCLSISLGVLVTVTYIRFSSLSKYPALEPIRSRERSRRRKKHT